ncbi:MAG: hypothetical protein K1X77_11720 [Bacteroidia bacterium]|nr:hypothetical protein [Bacteroidia bacterium]
MRLNSKIIGVAIFNLLIFLGFLALSFSIFEPSKQPPVKQSRYIQAALIGKNIRKTEKQELITPTVQEGFWATCETIPDENKKLLKDSISAELLVLKQVCLDAFGNSTFAAYAARENRDVGNKLYLSYAVLRI